MASRQQPAPSPEQQEAYGRAYVEAIRAQRNASLDALADLAGRDAVAALDDLAGRLARAEQRAQDNHVRAERAEAALRAAGLPVPAGDAP